MLRKFFSSLPMCSVIPDCGSEEMKIAWGSKKNKVLPDNKEVILTSSKLSPPQLTEFA